MGVAVTCLGLVRLVCPTSCPSLYSRIRKPVRVSTAKVGVLSLVMLSVLLIPVSLPARKSTVTGMGRVKLLFFWSLTVGATDGVSTMVSKNTGKLAASRVEPLPV